MAKIINNAPALSHWVELIYATFIYAHTQREHKKFCNLPLFLHCFGVVAAFPIGGVCTAERAIFLKITHDYTWNTPADILW